MKKPKVLCIIYARAGSKRIPKKNSMPFVGVPLITRTVRQARAVSFINRIIVDTDSPHIATLAKRAGAEIPYLRPKYLASDTSPVMDAIVYLLAHLKGEGYVPDYVVLLQTTSPLRDVADIEATWKKMKEGGATSVVTVCSTHPMLFHLGEKGELRRANHTKKGTSNTQSWPDGYLLNGCFVYILQTKALLREQTVLMKKTRAVVFPRWRSVDLDYPEDWVMAEFIFRNRKKIEHALKNFK